MATAPQARGRGLGAAVLEQLVDHARANGAVRVWCNARARRLARSTSAPASALTSDEFEIPPIGPHFVMERRLDHSEAGSALACSLS